MDGLLERLQMRGPSTARDLGVPPLEGYASHGGVIAPALCWLRRRGQVAVVGRAPDGARLWAATSATSRNDGDRQIDGRRGSG